MAAQDSEQADREEAQRGESPPQRLDRNTIELLNELRVAGTGIQVMFAFLLVVPFDSRFKELSAFETTTYFVTLLLVGVAAIVLLAPPIHHRILFRQGEKRYLVWLANYLAIAGMIFIALGFTGILILLSDVVVGGAAPVVVGTIAFLFIVGLWFVVPLGRRTED
ncbi:MAG: DUF6328 family protein [Solirubrobacteraceae bacterium]